MNTITRLLTELDPEADAPTSLSEHDEQLLLTILDQPIPQAVRRKRTLARRLVIVAAGVAAVVGIGFTQIDIGDRTIGASPAAAAVLEKAAKATLADPDPVVQPGQFLHITLVEDSWGAGSDFDLSEGDDLDAAKALGLVHQRRTRQIWIPHDRGEDWTIRDGTVALLNTVNEPTTTHRVKSWADKSGSSHIKTYDPDWYASLPRDPEQMLARIRMDIGTGDETSPSSLFEETYSEVLRSGVAPASVRAALFKQLATMPGMKVIDGVTNLDGTAGVAIAFGDKGKQLLFDRETGRYIGERASDPELADVPGLDDAKTTFLTSVTTDVVDRAPEVD